MSWKKKIVSITTAATLGLSLTFGAPVAEAVNAGTVGDIVGIFVKGASIKSQRQAVVKQLNATAQGQEAVYQDFTKSMGVDTSYEYNSKLDRLMTNLSKGVAAVDPSINNLPYKYFVADTDVVNAACGMGHVMFVNRGLFKFLTNEDELAAIIGHEMGHGQKNHVAKGYDKAVDQQIAAGILNATLGTDVLTSTLTDLALKHRSAHKDKKMETEADLMGVEYLVHTPYNIGATAAVMQRFNEQNINTEQSKETALFNPSDHPDTARRRDACAKKIFELSGKHVDVKDGVVIVNKKNFLTPAASSTMSGKERSYFVMGNLARAYIEGQNKQPATVVNGTVMLGSQPIITPVAGDEDAQTLADRLNSIK